MPDWGFIRGRNNEGVEGSPHTIGRAPPPNLLENGSPRRKATAPANFRSDKNCGTIDHLTIFRTHGIDAFGDMFFKVSRFQRSRRHYAELRGASIVVYRSLNPYNARNATVEDVMAVLPVHEYKIDVIDMGGDDSTLNPSGNLIRNNSGGHSGIGSGNNGATSRVYITPQRYTDTMTMYIRVYGQTNINAWRKSLGSLTSTPLPCLSTLRIESVIGRGGGGKVFVVNWGHDKKTYALKVIDKAHSFRSSKGFRHVASERILMEKVGRHPFLLPMEFAFQSDTNLFIGTPFCRGGDLASYMRHKGDNSPLPVPPVPPPQSSPVAVSGTGTSTREKGVGATNQGSHRHQQYQKKIYARLSEDQTKKIAMEVILGLEHIHGRGIVYRDLKPENIFIGSDGHILIGDYGLAKKLTNFNAMDFASDQASLSQDQLRNSHSTSTATTPSTTSNKNNNDDVHIPTLNHYSGGNGTPGSLAKGARMINSNETDKTSNKNDDDGNNEATVNSLPPRTMSICGTRNYLPPEMLNGRHYSFEADVWSLGIMLYRMLCGIFPFDGRRTKEVFHRIKKDRLRIPSWISPSAQNLLAGLLDKRPEHRMTLAAAKQSSFFRGESWDDVLNKRIGPCIADVEMGSSVQEALENFELSNLVGITLGEYVSENHDDTISALGGHGTGVVHRGGKPTHRRTPKNMMIGFEYVWTSHDEQDVQPLGMKQKSSGFAGLMSKISSVEMEQQLPFSPRTPFTGGGK